MVLHHCNHGWSFDLRRHLLALTRQNRHYFWRGCRITTIPCNKVITRERLLLCLISRIQYPYFTIIKLRCLSRNALITLFRCLPSLAQLSFISSSFLCIFSLSCATKIMISWRFCRVYQMYLRPEIALSHMLQHTRPLGNHYFHP